MLWGGNRIIPFKHLDSDLEGVGESREISGVEDNEPIAANGPDKGLTLADTVRKYHEELVGEMNYAHFGSKSPLLIKFIDAKQDLSIQVHLTDDLAKKGHNSMGETEMWYVANADKGAKLRPGFSEQITPKEYKERALNNTITDVLQRYEIKPGDVFFLPAGRVHSTGTGVFIVEIQQTSDTTYRIYDFNRKDTSGKTRELHTDLVREAINYGASDDYRTRCETVKDEPVELIACPYFITFVCDMIEEISHDYSELDSFVIFTCMKGVCKIKDNKDNELKAGAGESILFPVTTQNVTIIPEAGNIKLPETYV